MDKFVTPEQYAIITNYSVNAVYYWVAQRKCKFVKIKRRIYIPVDHNWPTTKRVVKNDGQR